ncbi:MAG: hypothetical protein OJF55_001426 [Rhodanobacteraceae bacterium]|nr:MAG: hypothetical protein OJF55_001426 [Rhodanobacteraceae bacterium]
MQRPRAGFSPLIVIPDARSAIRNRFRLFSDRTNHRFRVRSAMKLQPAPE